MCLCWMMSWVQGSSGEILRLSAEIVSWVEKLDYQLERAVGEVETGVAEAEVRSMDDLGCFLLFISADLIWGSLLDLKVFDFCLQ